MPHVIVTPDVLLNQFKRDAPNIAATFDDLCHNDLNEVSTLLAQAMTITTNGLMRDWDTPVRMWSAEVLTNIANTLSAAIFVLRAGYRLVPGLILRNAVEAMCVCLHGLQNPNDLQKITSHNFDSTTAIQTAKKIVPAFGPIYGHLSQQFVHIGPLHHSIQPVTTYTEKNDELLVNLRWIRASTWMFYVVAEFAFLDIVPIARYWKHAPPNSVIFAPSESEKEWQQRFLMGD